MMLCVTWFSFRVESGSILSTSTGAPVLFYSMMIYASLRKIEKCLEMMRNVTFQPITSPLNAFLDRVSKKYETCEK